MKINIAGVMNMISDSSKKVAYITCQLNNCIYTVSTTELNGTINVIEDNKNEFEELFLEYEEEMKKITKLKSILYSKNNSCKLSDGRTIQSAIIDNTNLRTLKNFYENLLRYKDSKKRITEVNNSYFECKNINYSKEVIKDKLKEVNDKISKTDFEISKLNAIEFEIDI